MNQTNQTLENNNQDKLWDNAFKSYLSSRSQKQLLTLNKQLCDKIVEKVQNKNLKRKTGSYRTMYKLEYLVFWYFQDKIEKSDSLKNKNSLNEKMRYTLKVINQELDNSEKINHKQQDYQDDSDVSESDSDSDYEDEVSENDSDVEVEVEVEEIDSENKYDSESYICSDSESDDDYDEEEEQFEKFRKEVYNMSDSDLNKSLEFRYLSTKGSKQKKITALLDFGPELPSNLTHENIERIVNKYKTEYLSESDDDNDPDYEPYKHKKNNKTYSDYQSDSDSDSDYEPYNHKKQ
tara:strand:- start:963 stop:1838 length:876 start_codon:yes stop_codon:yes gene_type:complete